MHINQNYAYSCSICCTRQFIFILHFWKKLLQKGKFKLVHTNGFFSQYRISIASHQYILYGISLYLIPLFLPKKLDDRMKNNEKKKKKKKKIIIYIYIYNIKYIKIYKYISVFYFFHKFSIRYLILNRNEVTHTKMSLW